MRSRLAGKVKTTTGIDKNTDKQNQRIYNQFFVAEFEIVKEEQRVLQDEVDKKIFQAAAKAASKFRLERKEKKDKQEATTSKGSGKYLSEESVHNVMEAR